MQLHTKFLPEVMKDNDIVYFLHLEGIIDSVDELAILEVTKHPKGYRFRLVPSTPKYTNTIVEELLKFHTMINIRLELSKSIKSSGGTIVFDISIE